MEKQPMIKLRGFWRSAATFRVRIALNLKGLAYHEEMINLDAGEQHAPDHVERNAHAAVPVMTIDDGPPMTQSLAILEYLDDLYPSPSLLPQDPEGRQRVRSIALDFAADHHPLIVPRIRTYLADHLDAEPDQIRSWIRHWFREGLYRAEARLAVDPRTGEFCHGNAPTIADLGLISHVIAAKGFQDETDGLPVIDRIRNACLAMDAFSRALPLRQAGAPPAH
jgi:maleylacetoacetate isomerase